MSTRVIKVPDVGEGVAEVELVAWFVQPGDAVTEDQTLADVMTASDRDPGIEIAPSDPLAISFTSGTTPALAHVACAISAKASAPRRVMK